MKLFFSKSPELESTPFSDFFRNTSSAEKKKVYVEVLKKASERQNKVLEAYNKAKLHTA